MIKDIIDSISNDNNIAAKTEELEYIEMLVLFKAFILASKIPELHYLQVKNTISKALLELDDIPEKPKRCIGEFSIYTIKCFQKVFYLLKRRIYQTLKIRRYSS